MKKTTYCNLLIISIVLMTGCATPYDGCNGIGCDVDNPDRVIDNRPQFDKDGNPNFDTHGNWIGCHGLGCN